VTSYLILGSGAAGVSAAEAIRATDPAGMITLVSEESEGYYSRPGLAYFLTGELPENQLFPFSKKEFERLRLEQLTARAESLDLAQRQVSFTGGKRLGYDRLLIATGSQAVPLRLAGSDAEGVIKLDNIADAQRILKLARRARAAVVVGGGITALEIVEGLTSRGVKVHYFLRGDRYWSNVLDEAESKIIEHRLKEEGVQVHYHTELGELITKDSKLRAVKTKDGRQIDCQVLAVAIGVQPRIELAEAAGLVLDRGILVDEFLQSSQSGVYAAGDVAQAFDPAVGKATLDTLWGPARTQGTIAGQNMAGKPAVFRKKTPFNVTRLAGLTTTIIGTVGSGRDEDLGGIARGDSETWRQLPDCIAAQSEFEVNRLRVLVGENCLVGALVMGDQTLSRPLQQLISAQVEIGLYRERFLQADVHVANLVADLYASWRQKQKQL
jgi:NADPH-dependent 2,4-dienoyl-CoA reductase/sulfur reductase-like enzyme